MGVWALGIRVEWEFLAHTSWFPMKFPSFGDPRAGDPGTARARRAAQSLEGCVEPVASYFFGARAAPHRLHRAGAK